MKTIKIQKTSKYYQGCNCCDESGVVEITFLRNLKLGSSGTMVTLCKKHLLELEQEIKKIIEEEVDGN